jgi:hypothetical protein
MDIEWKDGKLDWTNSEPVVQTGVETYIWDEELQKHVQVGETQIIDPKTIFKFKGD